MVHHRGGFDDRSERRPLGAKNMAGLQYFVQQPRKKFAERLSKLAVFRIEPFDTRPAIEVAAMTRNAKAAGSRKGISDATWAKLKFDRQIVAIAR